MVEKFSIDCIKPGSVQLGLFHISLTSGSNGLNHLASGLYGQEQSGQIQSVELTMEGLLIVDM